MNGHRAKELRRKAFQLSKGTPSTYSIITRIKTWWNEKTKSWVKSPRYQVKCEGFRAIYQQLKKEYYKH